EPPRHRSLQSLPATRVLLLHPEGAETVEEERAARVRVHDQHLEAAVGRAVACTRGEARVEIGRVARSLADGRRVLAVQLRDMSLDEWKHDVAVVELAKQ